MSVSRREDVSLRDRTSFGVGGAASEFYSPGTIAELAEILHAIHGSGRSPFILGGGCNTLFPDARFDRPVISTADLDRLEVAGPSIRAEAGVRLETLIRKALRSDLGGLEMFMGIPGTVGGAVAMNAGGSGWQFGDLVKSLTAIDPASGETVIVPGEEVGWGYRRTDLGGLVVAEAELRLEPEPAERLRERAREFMKRKATTQPLSSFSAGCVFRNPPGHSAAALIDRAGLKGLRVGRAMVSTVHANFIVNTDGSATSEDVLALIHQVRERVLNSAGVELELELVLAGEEERSRVPVVLSPS